MNTLILIAVIALVGLAGWQLMVGRSARRQARPLARTQKPATPAYHAVEVLAPGGCRAARAHRGVRYLSSEAPALPLPECSQDECRCRYRHHEDRRSGDRRTSLDVTYHQISESIGTERRNQRDRRQQLA